MAIRLDHRISRTKGTVETFYEDSSVLADNIGIPVADMTATVMAGTSASISSQTYSGTNEELAFTMNFSSVGKVMVRVQTTFSGSEETVTTMYQFRSLDDGTGSLGDYLEWRADRLAVGM